MLVLACLFSYRIRISARPCAIMPVIIIGPRWTNHIILSADIFIIFTLGPPVKYTKYFSCMFLSQIKTFRNILRPPFSTWILASFPSL